MQDGEPMREDFSLFKPKYTKPGKDFEGRGGTFHIRFRDHLRRRRTLAAYPDERRSIGLGRRIMALVSARLEGPNLTGDLRQWINSIDAKLRRRLVELELLDAVSVMLEVPLLDHLKGNCDDAGKLIGEAGFKQELTARGNTDEHIDTTVQRIERLLTRCALVYWRDLNLPGVVTRINVWLGSRRSEKQITGTTLNYYIRDFRAFCSWLHETGRAPAVALEELKPIHNADMDAAQRRALSIEELRWLIFAAEKGPTRYRMHGPERALVYRFCFETGIRPKQVRSLTVANFDLAATPATVTTQARHVKRRRQHVQTLTANMAKLLRTHFEGKMPAAVAFNMCNANRMAPMLREDLADARQKWVAAAPDDQDRIERIKSDFLEATNKLGEVAVFYSLRHSHGTTLADAGITQRDIAASMHHANERTTARYIHRDRQKAQATAIAVLPALDATEEMRKTGTTDAPVGYAEALGLRTACATGHVSVESGGVGGSGSKSGNGSKGSVNAVVMVIAPEMLKGQGGIRTHERRICNPFP